MTDINEFLSQRTQLCERQHARITPAQCQTCWNRGDAFCIGCAGLVPTYPLSIVQEEVEVSKKKVEPCAMCHRTMEIAGRGMCGKCYSVELKREKSSKNAPPLKPVIADAGFNRAKAAVTVPEPVEAVTEGVGVVTDIPVTLPPNWGKVPCEYCGTLLEFGQECSCAIPADEEPEPEHSNPAQNIPPFTPLPPFTGKLEWVPVDTAYPRAETMRQLLQSTNRQLVIPDNLAHAWEQLGLTGEHVLGLMELHLNGELAIRRYL